MAKAKTTAVSVQVRDFPIKKVVIPIKGTSPLIVHAWSEKAKQMMEDKQMGKAQSKKHDKRDPEADYEGAKHRSADGKWEGFPAAGFKAAMIRGAKNIGMEMKSTQMGFFILADDPITQLVKIKGKARMRRDIVRVGMGTADLRYRPEYVEWAADLHVEYNEGMLSIDQVHQLVKAAGHGCGIGEMRPERGKFDYGRFKLANEK